MSERPAHVRSEFAVDDSPQPELRRRPAGVAGRLSGAAFALTEGLGVITMLVVQVAWIAIVLSSDDPLRRVHLDWSAYYDAGRRLIAGDLRSIYVRITEPGYHWLYPPYCLYPTVVLGLLPEWGAYITCSAAQVLAVAGALALLRARLPASPRRHNLAAAIVLASMPFNGTVIIGQAAGLFSLLLAAVFWAWSARRAFVCGLLLSLMLAKPNLGLVFPAVCLVTRQWRVLIGVLVGVAVMVVGSLPLGVERWHEYVETMRTYAVFTRDATPMWKQATLYAFLHTVPGIDRWPGSWTLAIWIAAVVPLPALTVAVWRKRWRDRPSVLPRLFGSAILLAVAANFYLYLYDTLLLMFPAIAWYVRGDEYASRGARTIVGLCIGGVIAMGYVTVLTGTAIAWTGMLVTVWLVAEAYDLLLARAREPPAG